MGNSRTSRRLGCDAGRDVKIEINYLPIGSLAPDPQNARVHPEEQLKVLAKSIKAFGFVSPILMDQQNQIIVGHARWSAAKLLGLERVPTILVDHLTVAQRRAFALADNRLAELASWDKSLLAQHLKELTSVDLEFDIEATGFCVPEIDILIEGAEIRTEEMDAADDLAPINGPAVTRLGDLWVLGNHRVLCADALLSSSYNKLMNSAPADIIFTDAPYNVSITKHASTKGRRVHREFPMASGEMSVVEFANFLKTATKLLVDNSKLGSLHYLCMDWRHLSEMLEAGKANYAELKNVCVWVKSNGGMGALYRSQHEFVFVFKNGAEPHLNNVQLGRHGRNRSNVWNYPAPSAFGKPLDGADTHGLHPTAKPVALVADAIMDASRRGDIVLDGFLGSGSTLIAAEKTGRRCFGLELDALYVDAIVRRWEAFSGKAATHETGISFEEAAQQRSAGNGE